MTRRPTSLLLVLTLLGALVLSACGGAAGGADGYASFLAGLDATLTAGSSRVGLDSTTILEDGTSFTVTGEGLQKFDGSQAELTVATEIPGMGLPLNITTRVIDNVTYLTGDLFTQMLGEETWIKITPDDAGAMAGFDLSSMLEQQQTTQNAVTQLRGLAEDSFTKVGDETVNGVDATHWTGTINRDDALAALDDEMRAELDDVIGSLPETYDVDVWLDDQSRPVRIRTDIEFEVDDQTIQNVTILDLSDFGIDVDIEAPSVTTSFAELQDRMGGMGGMFGGQNG